MDRFNAWVGALAARIENIKDEKGQTFVEYALVLSVIVVGILLAVTATGLGASIASAIGDVADKLDPPATTGG
jgi:Flp pilus assembly pilin Flp